MTKILFKYNELRNLIAKRQSFENQKEQQKTPYSNHRTDNNFYDIHGYTLLHYASLLGDLAEVNKLIVEGVDLKIKPIFTFKDATVTALQMALEKGHIDVAKALFAQGSPCSEIPAAKVHENCRQWFNEKILESLKQSYPEISQGNFNQQSPSPFFPNHLENPLTRAAELGLLEIIKLGHKFYTDDHPFKQLLLNNAVCNGHQEVAEFLLSIGGTLNPQNLPYEETPLHQAVQHQQHGMITFLLESTGYLLDRQNEKKETALMLAVAKSDIKMFELLLSNKANVLLQDRFGDRVLHYAVRQNNPQITRLLLTHPEVYTLIHCKNNYGFTATDIAIDAGDDEQLAILLNEEQLILAKQRPDYDKKLATIDQKTVMRKMHYYLRLHYRDIDYFSPEGHCNGFSFLWNYYGSQGRKKYYLDTLRLISGWNGSAKVLDKEFPTELSQANYYKNLSSLIEQWIQDAIWFQASRLGQVVNVMQQQRARQFNFIRTEGELDNAVITVYQNRLFGLNMSLAQLSELITLIQKMPIGIQFQIGEGGHETSGDVIVPNESIDYYDSNFPYALDPEISQESLASLVMDTKYRALKKVSPNEMISASFHTYYFKDKSKTINLDEFILFADNQLPNSKESAQNYQKKSPCKFTPLHAAIFTGSLKSFKKLLHDGYCDITAKNAFGQTVFDMALENGNICFMELILDYASVSFNICSALKSTFSNDNNEFFELLLKYAQPADCVDICCHAINLGNIPYAEQFVHNHSVEIINLASSTNKRIIFEALKIQDTHLVNLLLKKGASIDFLVTNEFGDEVSIIQYIIGNTNQCLDLVLQYVSPNFIDKKGMASIHYAAQFYKKDILEKLLSKNVDPLLLTSQSKSPLEIMLQNRYESIEHWACVETLLSAANSTHLSSLLQANLLEQGELVADLLKEIVFDLTSPMQRNVLLILIASSIKSQQPEQFVELVKRADSVTLNGLIDGKPLLVQAIASQNISMAKSLLEKGVSINNTTVPGGSTALHIALKMKCSTEFVELLLNYGADPDLKNKAGENSKHLAASASEEIKELVMPTQQRPTFF